MIVSSFFQGDLRADPAMGLQALLRAILVRTNFVPVVRHILGWRGLRHSVSPVEGWTAKISASKGIFGLTFDRLEPADGWIQGRFWLYYFPDPQEDLVERCSLQAAALTQTEDFLQRVRTFSADAEFSSNFSVGALSLAMEPSGSSFALAVEAPSVMRCISEAGVRLPRAGQMVQLVAPGGCLQDFPSFEVACAFFDVLCASATLNLDQPPVFIAEHCWPGDQLICSKEGKMLHARAADVCNRRILLGYGSGPFEVLEPPARDEQSVKRWVAGEPLPETFKERLWWHAHRLQGAATIDKKSLGIDERPPLILLTGFLGSGKTSFLKHFIEYETQRSRFVAVIQNEIGAVGLDGKLLDYTVTEVDEGCVCCSLVGNLKRAIGGILSAFAPDVIIVETSGLANPLNLLPEIRELEELVRYDCTLTLVDALNVEAALSGHAIAADQIRGADALILNKKDLATPDRLAAVTRRLKQLNPRAPIFRTVEGDLNPALILEAGNRPSVMATSATSGQHTHLHDGLWARSVRFSRPLERGLFLEAVDRLPPSVFRVKGILEFTDSPQPMLLQYVAGRFELSAFSGKSTGDRFLTVIGCGPETITSIETLQ